MPKFTCDKDESEQFFLALNSYMQENVLSSDDEILDENFKEHRDQTGEELGIQLPHVGKSYEMKRDGKPFRIAIFGQDPADRYTWNMKKKRGKVEGFNEGNYGDFNPHMKGTLHTLQLLFGLDVDVEVNKREIEMDSGEKCKIFNAFCLSNACLYKLDDKEKTKTMIKNNQPHFKKTIKILKPQIVILQGDVAIDSFNEAFSLNQERDEVSVNIINEKHVLSLALYHPSAPYGPGYDSPEKAENYLRPLIARLLEMYKEIWRHKGDNAPV